jgi:hypothetical protein
MTESKKPRLTVGRGKGRPEHRTRFEHDEDRGRPRLEGHPGLCRLRSIDGRF